MEWRFLEPNDFKWMMHITKEHHAESDWSEVEYDEEYTRPVYTNEFKEQQKEILEEMMKNDQELGLYDEPFDNTSDWDVTLMDGLEDEEPFFTEEEVEKILQEEPTEEEIQRNFSTIEPKTENILQEEPTTTVNNKILTTIEQHKKNGYKVSQIPEDDERMNIIGQNGNEGLHYDNEEDTSLEKNDEKKN